MERRELVSTGMCTQKQADLAEIFRGGILRPQYNFYFFRYSVGVR